MRIWEKILYNLKRLWCTIFKHNWMVSVHGDIRKCARCKTVEWV